MALFIKNHKKLFLILILILILAGAGYYFFRPNDSGKTQTVYSYGTVETGMIMQSVSGTGQISAARESSLKSKTAGLITEVAVASGQKINAGDIIARIDDSDAKADVQDAREAVASARLSLEKLSEPPDDLSLMQAQNALAQAEESLAGNQSSLSETYQQGFSAVVAAFSDLPSMMAELQNIVAGASSYVTQSNSTYIDYYADAVKSYDSQASELAANAAMAYRRAELRYNASFENYKLMSRSSASEDEIRELIDETRITAQAVAESLKAVSVLIQRYKDILTSKNLTTQSFADTQLASLASHTSKCSSYLNSLLSASQDIDDAQKAIVNSRRTWEEKTESLAKLTEDPDELELKTAELSLAQKERALADALENLQDCAIAAPFDGVVASISVKKGDEIASGAAIAAIITENQIATVTLNEVDIAKVKTGQKATMTFSAIEDLVITGVVAEVGVLGSVNQGVVSYDVIIALDEAGEQVKPGMSVSATIITQVAQNILVVPSAAIKTANDGSNYVLVSASGETAAAEVAVSHREQTVEVGLSDDVNTEITGGLVEGERVVISSAKQTASSSSDQKSGSSMFNVGGIGGPMMR
jgi:Membrane-fusion protein